VYQFTVTRPVAISMVVIGVAVFGIIAYQQLPLNLMPKMSYPRLTIRTEYPGSGPEEVELELSRQIESLLGTVSHLTRLSSRSRAGLSEVIVEFDWRAKLDLSMQEVREKLDLLRLPEGAKRPVPLRYDPNLDPMMRMGLYASKKGEASSPALLYQLRLYAEEVLRPALETLPGVAAVKVRGGLEQQVVVALNEQKLRGFGLQISQVVKRLREANINLAGGQLKEGTTYYWVRTLNEFVSVADMRDLLIAQRDNKLIRLRDIAHLSVHNKDREVITRINSSPSVELSIYREADANIVDVSRRVRQRIFGTARQRAYVQTMGTKKSKQTRNKKRPKKAQKRNNQAKRKGRWRRKSRKGRRGGKKGRKGKRGRRGGGKWAIYKAMRKERMKKRKHRQMTRFLLYEMPAKFDIQVLSDQAVFIKNSIDEVLQSAIIGGGFAVLVLLLFMRNVWSTVIIGLSIPLSVVATFGGMYLTGVSLNIMSLGGLALGIGMLVDNSIVVLESILRCREDGLSIQESAVKGVSEVGSAVTASTLTTVAVFLPIVFVQGAAGQLLRDLALTVCLSLLSSLVVSLYFIPMLSALRLPGSDPLSAPQNTPVTPSSQGWGPWIRLKESVNWLRESWQRGGWSRGLIALFALPFLLYLVLTFPLQAILDLIGRLWRMLFVIALWLTRTIWRIASIVATYIWAPIFWVMDRFLNVLNWVYPRVLRVALHQRGLVLLGGIAMLAYAYVIFPTLKQEFMPKVHQGEFHLELTFPVGTPLAETERRMQPIAAIIRTLPEVQSFHSVLGVEKDEIQHAEKGEHSATVSLRLKPSADIQASEKRTITKVREALRNIPGLKMKVVYPSLFTLRTPVEVEIRGEHLPTLKRLSQEALLQLQDIPGLRDVRSSAVGGLPEIQIQFNRERLLRYNLTVEQVAQAVRSKLLGNVATRFRRREQRLDVLVRVQKPQLKSVQELRRLTIVTPQGQAIPLKQVAHFKVDEGPSEILRVGNRRAVVLRAELEGVALGEAKQFIEDSLLQLKKPSGYTVGLSGQSKEMETSLQSLLFALLLSVFLVYLVMASQFESLLSPFVILFSIPLAFVGVVLVFSWLDMAVSSMVLIGMIILTGIVVNNAIVLIDAVGRLRDEGRDVTSAIMEAGLLRLRPILMTTATTVLGLIPLALGLGEGSELRRPMAITLIIGLLGSTLLTLVIIPALYHLLNHKRTTTHNTEESPS
jgi:HAE1 family hydrophobic/amphiphilic exporter-1